MDCEVEDSEEVLEDINEGVIEEISLAGSYDNLMNFK